MLRTILAELFLILFILIAGPPFILHCILTGSPEWLYRVGLAGARVALRIAGVRVVVEGLKNIPDGVCIFVGNHTSNVDPPVVVSAIPRRVAMLGKKEVWKIPIVSTALTRAAFIPVDRADREAAMASVEAALRHIRSGVSYLIFPEGTRSPDGRLRAFKKGAFLMAIRAEVPIVPVSVIGAQIVQPRGAVWVRSGTVRVVFHPVVDGSSYSAANKDNLIAVVHAAVASALPPEQKPEEC
jgi:1-acyl-sn-glycerol-3-phosphate acyltransferase